MKEKLPYVTGYRELLVYRQTLELADEIFFKTRSFPKEEAFSLTSQIRRSSRAIGAQIAEAWGKRLYVKHFVSKLTDAIAELYETEHWVEVSSRCGYISDGTKITLKERCVQISSLLAGMINKAEKFCEERDRV